MACQVPFVSADLINRMIEKATKNPDSQIVASFYEKQMGIPVLFKRSLFNDLLELKGDEGAKKIVLKNKETCDFIDFPEGKFDLDTIDEYRNFVSNYNQN